jgi:4-diphosphocytidyl-2-C-methyl-D-erythritol kinase
MGGGSGDAAAALRLAAEAAGRPDDPALARIAPRLGADVPSQLRPGPVLVTGAGEHVEPLPDPPPHAVLVLPAEAALATPDVFREADRLGLGRDADGLAAAGERLAAAARAGTLPAELLHNDLEPAARSLCPAIDRLLADARAAGADVAMVSGSGPTVIGIFLGREGLAAAGDAAAALAARHPRAVAAVPVDADWAAPRAR